MSINKNDHEKMITCKQVIMRPNEVNKNGRIYPTMKNEGDNIMKNKQNGEDNIMRNEALKNLKELAESVNNIIDHISDNKSEANTKNVKEDNSYDNTCECRNKHDDSPKESHDDNVDGMIKSFINHLENVLGVQAEVIPINGSKSFTDFISSICDKCDNREYCDSFGADDEDEDEDEDDDEDDVDSILEEIADKQDDIIKYLEHLEEGIRIIMREQNEPNIIRHMLPDTIRKGKPRASKKRVKKLERKVERLDHIVDVQQKEINMLKVAIKELTTPKDSKSGK